SSDVCSSDLAMSRHPREARPAREFGHHSLAPSQPNTARPGCARYLTGGEKRVKLHKGIDIDVVQGLNRPKAITKPRKGRKMMNTFQSPFSRRDFETFVLS